MRRTLLLTILPLALTACAPASTAEQQRPPMTHGMTVVNVTASYRERILLTTGHVLTVRVEDVSRADAPAVVLADHTEVLDGRAPPYHVTIGVPTSEIDPRHTYAVRAEIRDPTGALRFTTDSRHAVLTRDAPAGADIMLVAVP